MLPDHNAHQTGDQDARADRTDGLDARLDQHRAALAVSRAETEAAREEVRRLRAEADATDAAHAREIAMGRAETEAAREENRRLRAEADASDTAHAREIAMSRAETETARTDNARLRAEAYASDAAHGRAMDASRAETAAARADNTRLRAEADATGAAHGRAMDASRAETAAAWAEIGQLRANAVEADAAHARELAAGRAELEAARSAIAALHAMQAAARESEERLRGLLQGAADYAVIALDDAGRITLWNAGARALFGWQEAEVLGQPSAILFTDEDRGKEAPSAEMAQALAEGRSSVERWHRRRDGSRFFGIQFLMPLRDGHPAGGFLKIVRDRTEERRVADERRRSNEWLHLILESATEYAIFTLDRERRVSSWNAGAQRVLGFAEDAILGRSGDILFTPEDRAAGAPEREFALAVNEGRAVNERWHVRADGSRIWSSGLVMPLRDPADGCLKIMRDMTEQRRAAETQQVLVGELNHRVKNILMAVQSLAEQTIRTTDTPSAFVTALRGRLAAMARAHDLLTSRAWEGADLAELVRVALAPWLGEGRIALAGPAVSLHPRQALALSMALHELATNALKYGGLSVPAGRVSIAWRVQDGVELRWEESGGPPVQPPTRQGFGSRVLNRALAAELGGAIDLRFAPSGVTCAIRFAREPGVEGR
ncbi:MAG: PAS domain S-box protein [Acetobacteraceae bacterium]|nr:PAS domain S-box protein [Acetobacteraceae bacterium]